MMIMKAKTARRLQRVLDVYNVAWVLAQTVPALLLWALSLFSLKVEFRHGWDRVVDFPGWSENTLTWFLTQRGIIHLDVKVLS